MNRYRYYHNGGMQIIGWTKSSAGTVPPNAQESADGIPGVCITCHGNVFAYYNIKGAQYELFFFCIPLCYVAHSIFLSAETPVSPLRTKRFKLLRACRHFTKKIQKIPDSPKKKSCFLVRCLHFASWDCLGKEYRSPSRKKASTHYAVF